MQSLFQKYRHALWFLLFGALSVFYFVSQHLGLRYHVVHLPLDDWLPFWPGFIVFYVLWYFYVPGCMLWACFRARDVFYRQVAALFSGAFVCAAVFVLYPTCVDFRPSAAGPGLARALCRLIYANDAPVNVFPSLHCYEALVMHLPGRFRARRYSVSRKATLRFTSSTSTPSFVCFTSAVFPRPIMSRIARRRFSFFCIGYLHIAAPAFFRHPSR